MSSRRGKSSTGSRKGGRRGKQKKKQKGSSGPPLTLLARKRLHIPKIDLHDNPFCQDRQLADQYAVIHEKPQMVKEVEVALRLNREGNTEKDPLPASVFAPHPETLERRRNRLYGTAKLAEKVSREMARRNGDDIAEGSTLMLPGLTEVERKQYFPDPIEVTSKLRTKPLNPNIGPGRAVSFGHRPSSASRHFDPLTTTASRQDFKRSAAPLPRVGLLSSTDLHRLLKFGDDVVGTGPPPHERGQIIGGSAEDTDEGAPNDLEGQSQESKIPQTPMGDTPGAGSIGRGLSQGSFEMRMETNAPHDVAVPPAWMGGTFAIGHGKPLFFQKKSHAQKPQRRKDTSNIITDRQPFENRVWKPPPQRAFKSDMLADAVAFNTASSLNARFKKISAGIMVTPVCEQRQADDLAETRDLKKRMYKSRPQVTRHYLKSRIRSSSPRMRFRHDIDEIMKEVEWRINEEKLAAEEEEKIKDIEGDADVDDLHVDGNGSEGNDDFVESDQTGDGDGQQYPQRAVVRQGATI